MSEQKMKLQGVFQYSKIAVFVFILLFQGAGGGLAATTDEMREWLAAHNEFRAMHDVPPVTWSYSLAQSASEYAATCPTGHSTTSYGENLAWASYAMSPQQVVALWYNEVTDYDYNHPGFDSSTGHFTQVIWKGTTQIGCAYKEGCETWSSTWVCRYSPAGNVSGQFEENVYPPADSIETPDAPTLAYATSGMEVNISWTAVSGAEGYTLYYAPYPYLGEQTIQSVDMGGDTSLTAQLWENAAFYIAVTARNQFRESEYSNIEYFVIDLY